MLGTGLALKTISPHLLVKCKGLTLREGQRHRWKEPGSLNDHMGDGTLTRSICIQFGLNGKSTVLCRTTEIREDIC